VAWLRFLKNVGAKGMYSQSNTKKKYNFMAKKEPKQNKAATSICNN